MRRPRRSGKGTIGRHNGPEGFASKYEQAVYHDALGRGFEVRYEPRTFQFYRRIRGGKCRDCGSRETTKLARYTPDFGLGGGVYVETKGKFDSSARSKQEDFTASRPDVDVRWLFAADNWTTKKHIRRYSDWCKERGVTYAVGKEIPQEWFEEAASRVGRSEPPEALHEPPSGDRVHRRRRTPTVQCGKRDKVPVESGTEDS